MIPMIQQAITMGYTAAQVLNYISKKFKSSSPGISSARQQGYDDEDILKFLSGKFKPKNKKSTDEQLTAQERYMKSVGIKTKEEKQETRNKYISGAVDLGLTAMGAYNIYKGYKGGLQGLGQTFGIGGTAQNRPPNTPSPPINPPAPGAPINPPPQAPQTPGQMATPQTPMPGVNIGQQIQQGTQAPINAAMQPQTPVQLGQAANAVPQAPEAPKQPLFEQLLKGVDIASLAPEKQQQLNFLAMISDKLESQGKTLQDPEFKSLAEKVKKTLTGKPSVLTEELSRDLKPEIAKAPAVKDSIVNTPQGVGEVKAVNNGKAIVEINGKAHKIDEKEIEPPPIPEKDLADLHNDLIAGIEKATGKEVSRHVDWVGYDPDANELQYKPWGGTSYTLNDIDPEDIEMLTGVLTQRKTTGSNWIGGWDADTESPIGAAMHKLLEKLKAKAKEKGVKEYTRKYQTVYSAREPAEQAAKLKKKLEEQERKKKEKDAKKAKK